MGGFRRAWARSVSARPAVRRSATSSANRGPTADQLPGCVIRPSSWVSRQQGAQVQSERSDRRRQRAEGRRRGADQMLFPLVGASSRRCSSSSRAGDHPDRRVTATSVPEPARPRAGRRDDHHGRRVAAQARRARPSFRQGRRTPRPVPTPRSHPLARPNRLAFNRRVRRPRHRPRDGLGAADSSGAGSSA